MWASFLLAKPNKELPRELIKSRRSTDEFLTREMRRKIAVERDLGGRR
jgi:hypothetical protein